MGTPAKKTVLITGATGNIGSKLRWALNGTYNLRLLDRDPHGDQMVIQTDLSYWHPTLLEHFDGVDAVIHLAASPDERMSWAELVAPNLDALNNIFMAAAMKRTPRIIFFSSNHVMGGYQHARLGPGKLTTDLDPRPGTIIEYPPGTTIDSTPYAAMKLAGERLGSAYAQATDGVFIAIRSGWVLNRSLGRGHNLPEDLPPDGPEWYKRMWFSTSDLLELVRRAIEQPLKPRRAIIVNGMSNNDGMVWDMKYAEEVLGFTPQDGLTINFQNKKTV